MLKVLIFSFLVHHIYKGSNFWDNSSGQEHPFSPTVPYQGSTLALAEHSPECTQAEDEGGAYLGDKRRSISVLRWSRQRMEDLRDDPCADKLG